MSRSALPVSSPLLRSGMPPALAVGVACLSSFMVVMDGAIVNVALPAMQTDMHLSAAALQWVVDAYLLVLGGFMLLAARAGDLLGRRRVLQAGLLVFTLASLAGGLADSAPVLLAARALQGLGASALATSTLALIVAVHPAGPARGRAISAWAASSAIASAVGVSLGGLLTSAAGWRWVMFVNVPLGLLLMGLSALCFAPVRPQNSAGRLDLAGAVTITLATGLLIFGLSQAPSLGWQAAAVAGPLLLAAVLLGLFVRQQGRAAQPLVGLAVFRIHNVRIGSVVVLGLGASLTAATFFVSLCLQRAMGYDPLRCGLAMLPMAMALAAAAMVARAAMDAGVRRMPFLGGAIAAAGLLWLARLPAGALFVSDVLGPTLLVGAGLGLMLMTATHTAIDGIPPQDAGLASGLFNTTRQLGAALGIALLLTLAHGVAAGVARDASPEAALLAGYRAAFAGTAAIAALAALASLRLRRLPPA